MMDKILAIALLANLEYTESHEVPNGYWPEAYVEERKRSPWVLFAVEGGTFTIGWRKRVIAVSWTVADADPIDDLKLRWITHGPRLFHAYDYGQAVTFLTRVVKQVQGKGR